MGGKIDLPSNTMAKTSYWMRKRIVSSCERCVDISLWVRFEKESLASADLINRHKIYPAVH